MVEFMSYRENSKHNINVKKKSFKDYFHNLYGCVVKMIYKPSKRYKIHNDYQWKAKNLYEIYNKAFDNDVKIFCPKCDNVIKNFGQNNNWGEYMSLKEIITIKSQFIDEFWEFQRKT